MFPSGLGTSWETIALVVVSTVGVYLALIVFSRVAGLRSFAEMTNFDMAATVAFGSAVATTAVSGSVSLLQGVVGLAVLFAVQALIAWIRKYRAVEKVVDGGPLLLMHGSQMLSDNLARGQITRDDLRAKLRLAGVTRMEQVRAVVLESTGEVSVLTAEPDEPPVDPELLSSVDTGKSRAPGKSPRG